MNRGATPRATRRLIRRALPGLRACAAKARRARVVEAVFVVEPGGRFDKPKPTNVFVHGATKAFRTCVRNAFVGKAGGGFTIRPLTAGYTTLSVTRTGRRLGAKAPPTLRHDMTLFCDVVRRSGSAAHKNGSKRAMVMATYLDEHLRNPDVVAMYSQLAQVEVKKKIVLIKRMLSRAGIRPRRCSLFWNQVGGR